MKSLSRLLLSVAFLLAFAVAALPMLASASAEPWPSAPVTITDANADFDLAAFGWRQAVNYQHIIGTSSPITRDAGHRTERTPVRRAGSSSIARLSPDPFDPIADWRARVRSIA